MPPATSSRSRTATAATTSSRAASRSAGPAAREKTVESIKAARASRAVRDPDHADEIKAKLEGSPVDVKVRAGEGGRLFGAVTTAEIAARARRRRPARRSTSARSWSSNPIKSLGAHEVSVKLHDEVSATVALNVIPA